MRRRWRINWTAVGTLYVVWFVAWIALSQFLKTQARVHYHGPAGSGPGAPWWSAVACFAPLVIVGGSILLHMAWQWWRTGGWFVRREYEPVHEDLRKR